MAAAKGNRYAEMRLDNPAYKPAQIKELCEDLLDWAENAKDLHLAGWARKHQRTTGWTNHLAENYPDTFGVAHKQAMKLLGRKMLNASFFGSGNATVGMAYLPIYDKDFKALIEWKANLAKIQPSQITQTFAELKKAAIDGSLLEMLTQQDETKGK